LPATHAAISSGSTLSTKSFTATEKTNTARGGPSTYTATLARR
jgi:hypothetical protein